MILEYKNTVIDIEKLYYVDCGFFKEKICFVLWDDLMAFMSKTVGFDYSIKSTSVDVIPKDTPIYIPQKPEFGNGYSNYKFVKLEDVIIPEECESVFRRFENQNY
jgi:hypothetical protein